VLNDALSSVYALFKGGGGAGFCAAVYTVKLGYDVQQDQLLLRVITIIYYAQKHKNNVYKSHQITA
jgi:hypothetical protein